MADPSTTGDCQRRSVIDSAFYDSREQRDWLIDRNGESTGELLCLLEQTHERMFLDVFVDRTASTMDDTRRRYEAVEDIATILKDRGILPSKFDGYVLDPENLPWKTSPTSL